MKFKNIAWFILILILLVTVYMFEIEVAHSEPQGPNDITLIENEKGPTTAAVLLNTTGGSVSTINISATSQNNRWKAYVGNISGTLVLQDSTGSKVYDWSLTNSLAGEIYATRNSSTVEWSGIKCANNTLMELENYHMNHTNPDDNITTTFAGVTHTSFFVGSISIDANSCPTTNTYVNNVTQDVSFEEILLGTSGTDGNFTGGGTLVYTGIVEPDITGFDNQTYDFQMMVPENGADGTTGSTAYYFYAELI
jgi:hypothetical protein